MTPRLHHSDARYGVRTDIWGRRPVVLARVAFTNTPRSANYILQIGRICLSWGPAGGVEEGRASAAPHRSRRPGRIWWTPDGARAIAIDWDSAPA